MTKRPHKRWTEAEIKYLTEHYSPATVSEVCSFLGRTVKSVSGKAFLMGLCATGSCPEFTDAEKEAIVEMYRYSGPIEIAKHLNRTQGSIKTWASRNGLKVSKEYRTQYAIRANQSWTRSEETRRKIGVGHRKESSALNSIVRQMLWPVWNYPVLERDDFTCRTCGSTEQVCVHHVRKYSVIRDMVIEAHPEVSLKDIHGRYEMAKLIVAEHAEDDGITLCRNCHSKIHGKKQGELQEHLTATGEGNLQPSHSNVLNFVEWKVQRLTGEDAQSNKPDTSALHVRKGMMT